MIAVMDHQPTDTPTASRVGVMMRLPLPLREGLQHRLAATSAISMNSYLEALIVRDLSAGQDAPFRVCVAPVPPSSGARSRGRPTKGPRSLVLLRADPALRELIHLRAAALGLRLNDYFESLVSQDISAANTAAGQESPLDKTA